MRFSLRHRFAAAVLAAIAAASCRPAERPEPRPAAPRVDGTIAVDGLSAPVRVVRDRWGVPHIYARSRDDLFFAQGFVQAQDRLFQIDLWRRASLGRLAEVLGSNFIERDAMTRRILPRSAAAQWEAAGPEARAIAEAFVRGVNAWLAIARQRPGEEFALAGWPPDDWSADDLLNRTDAFVAAFDAAEPEIRRRHGDVVANAIRRAGTAPFFSGLAVRLKPDAAGERDVAGRAGPGDRELASPRAYLPTSPSRTEVRGGVTDMAYSPPRYSAPSPRYLVHLIAPDIQLIGAAEPWRPGLDFGWDLTRGQIRGQTPGWTPIEVIAEPIAGTPVEVVKDRILVKGRVEPFEYETHFSPSGVVVATDRATGKYFTLVIGREGQDGRREEREGRDAQVGLVARAVFEHPLAITDAARRRFNVGPIDRPAADDHPVRLAIDPRAPDDWRAMNAPGQSESPASPHFADLAALWSKGELFRLPVSAEAVTANASSTLTLVPGRRR